MNEENRVEIEITKPRKNGKKKDEKRLLVGNGRKKENRNEKLQLEGSGEFQVILRKS